MKNIRKYFVAILIISAGIYHANAKGFQPHVFYRSLHLIWMMATIRLIQFLHVRL